MIACEPKADIYTKTGNDDERGSLTKYRCGRDNGTHKTQYKISCLNNLSANLPTAGVHRLPQNNGL